MWFYIFLFSYLDFPHYTAFWRSLPLWFCRSGLGFWSRAQLCPCSSVHPLSWFPTRARRRSHSRSRFPKLCRAQPHVCCEGGGRCRVVAEVVAVAVSKDAGSLIHLKRSRNRVKHQFEEYEEWNFFLLKSCFHCLFPFMVSDNYGIFMFFSACASIYVDK